MKEILDKIELKHFISNDGFLKSKYPDDKNSINSKNMQIAYNTISIDKYVVNKFNQN